MPKTAYLPRNADPAAAARQLIQRAHNQDGLPEIAVGTTFLLISCLICLQLTLPKGSLARNAAIIALALLIPLLCAGTPWMVRWVRSRYLLERVGYVRQYPITRRQIALGFTLALLTAAALLGTVATTSRPDGWLLAATGLFGGALAAWAGRLPRFAVYGIVMAATGLILALSTVPLELGFAILFGLTGLLILVSGCVVLSRLIRQPLETGE